MATNPFEIGLVGAGAVSAGAYTGGVLDFIVQALDAWYAERSAGNPRVPGHDVRLSVFSGASAGAVTAALAAGHLGSDQPPITSPDQAVRLGGRNKLYDSWVNRVDIASLLGDRDLQGGRELVSLLDSTILDEVAASALDVSPRPERRPWLAEDFHLLLTVTNLRGVPYGIPLDSTQPADAHPMSLHADHVHFCINASGNGTESDTGSETGSDTIYLSWSGLPDSPGSDKLKLAALASSAFPVGIAPRELERELDAEGRDTCYSARLWPVPLARDAEQDGSCRCIEPQAIPAAFGDGVEPHYRYRFLCVDGGVMNNEPLELARQQLAGPGGRNPREGNRAKRAVLMIDPFPGDIAFDPKHQPPKDLVQIIMALIGAMKNQSRFKPDELMLAAYPRNYSRFLIAPRRADATNPLACGGLGGFGGFLKRDFRHHDFFLGRRNAQKFLRDHFVLPESNPLFSEGWPEPLRDAYCVRKRDGTPEYEDEQRLLPIIPLVGEATNVCEPAPWPSYSNGELADLRAAIQKRADRVMNHLVDRYFGGSFFMVRWVARMVVRSKKKDLARWAAETVAADLRKSGLMR